MGHRPPRESLVQDGCDTLANLRSRHRRGPFFSPAGFPSPETTWPGANACDEGATPSHGGPHTPASRLHACCAGGMLRVISLMQNLPRREALITVPATVPPSVLPFGSPWWTQCRCGKGRGHGLYSPRRSRQGSSAATPRPCSLWYDVESPELRLPPPRACNASLWGKQR